MVFSSVNEFLAMGGHGPYVWSAWGVTALLFLVIVWHARLERRQLLRGLKRRARRENQAASYPHGSAQAPVKPAQGDVHHDA
ncbi:MAG: heme exporter protein CcmD [Halomonas sp.]|uniref:heme exporter protein CcmD n=1 Tax=unclassified Halomonas TaxID=2609666 RepID=UPI000990844D|nr:MULTISPECIES: heme exporter protein CcmD [unclassified Halomonas]AQU83376.1 heme exporter protein CcmD [Halomonas sp. 'Soap Lake \